MKHRFKDQRKLSNVTTVNNFFFNFEDELLRITKQLVAQSNLCARLANQGQINTFIVSLLPYQLFGNFS